MGAKYHLQINQLIADYTYIYNNFFLKKNPEYRIPIGQLFNSSETQSSK